MHFYYIFHYSTSIEIYHARYFVLHYNDIT